VLVQSYFIHTHSFDGLWFVGTDSDAHVAENEKERDVLRWFSVVFGHGGTRLYTCTVRSTANYVALSRPAAAPGPAGVAGPSCVVTLVSLYLGRAQR